MRVASNGVPYVEKNHHVKNAADFIVSYLQSAKVDVVFGITGGALEPLCDAFGRAEKNGFLKVVSARNENGAAYMAQAYGQETGSIGVCFVTTGPGATNALTAVASAYAEEVPMLIISAMNNQRSIGTKPFQDSSICGVDTVKIFSSCTRYSAEVTHSSQLERHLINAIQYALGETKGPVHLAIPANVLTAPVSQREPLYDVSKLKTRAVGDGGDILQVIDNLQQGPVALLIGEGVGAHMPKAIELANLLNADVVVTPAAKGLIRTEECRYRGVIGFAGHVEAREVFDGKEKTVLIIGTACDEWDIPGSADRFFYGHQVVHLDEVASHFINVPMASQRIYMKIQVALDILCEQIKGKVAVHEKHERAPLQHKHSLAPLLAETMYSPIHPKALMRKLSEAADESWVFFADVGNSTAWAIHDLEAPTGWDYQLPWLKVTTRFAAMGWGLGNAVGHALARPTDKVVCIVGDGALLMNGQEISVANELGLSVLFVVLNDASYGMVKHGQRINNAEPVGNKLPKVDFSMLARSQGVSAMQVNTTAELLKLDWESLMKQSGPFLLDVKIDGDAVPPIAMRTTMIKEGHTNE